MPEARILYGPKEVFSGSPDEVEAWLELEHERFASICHPNPDHRPDHEYDVEHVAPCAIGDRHELRWVREDGHSFRVRQHLWRAADALHKLSLVDACHAEAAEQYHRLAREFQAEKLFF